jgi:predicted NodU family carbamoyl transferase
MSEPIDTFNHERFIEPTTVSVLEQDSPVRSAKRAVIPAVTQREGSVRPQTIGKRIHPLYWRPIDDFEQSTGLPVLLNAASHLQAEAPCTLPPMPIALSSVPGWALWS